MDYLSVVGGRMTNEMMCVSRRGERRGAHPLKGDLKDRAGREDKGTRRWWEDRLAQQWTQSSSYLSLKWNVNACKR